MQLTFGLSTIISLAVLSAAGNHKGHLNRQHDALAKRMPGNVDVQKRFSGSRWSWYDAHTGNAGACGRYINNDEWAVALNTPQYGGGYPGPHCGKTITLRYNGKTAQATILDQCPGCPWGGLDLTPGLFQYFAPHSEGIIYGEWDFGGGDAPAPSPTPTPPPPPPPRPTTTTRWQPPPTTTTRWQEPTTTWQPPPPPPTTSSSQWRAPPSSSSSSSRSRSSTHSSSATSASASHSASASASASGSGTARPTGSGVPGGSGGDGSQQVLANSAQLLVSFGRLVAQGAAAAGN